MIPSNTSESKCSRFPGILVLLLPMALYTGLVTLAVVLMRERLNPDAISYIEIARRVSEGKWAESVSGYWSPLLSWSMAPMLIFGMDPLYAARISLAIWGGGLVIAWHILLQTHGSLNRYVHCATLCLIAMSVAWWAVQWITPDIILAACLALYFAAVLSEKLFRKAGYAVGTGLVGGVCYLAKSYAFPFFLAHFTLTVFMKWKLSSISLTARHATRTWILGIAGFLMIAGPWVGVLSSKYQKFTFSNVGPVAHAAIGPKKIPRHHPIEQLQDPADGRITVWETPEQMDYHFWSPFDSLDLFMHQIREVVRASLRLLNQLGNYDLLFFSIPALLLAPLLFNFRRNSDRTFWTLWALATVILYSGGFTLVYSEPRYLEAVLWPLIFANAIILADTQFNLPKFSRMALISLVLFSFFCGAPLSIRKAREVASEDLGRYRAIAEQLSNIHHQGRFATSHDWNTATFVAYHAQFPSCGIPAETESAEIDAALSRHDVQSFLVLPDWPLADDYRANTSWQKKGEFKYNDETYTVYGP